MDADTYLRESERTLSGEYHSEIVTANEIDFMLQAVIAGATWADRVKRGLFYGTKIELKTGGGSTTSAQHRPELANLLHAVLGCITESAELAEQVLHALRGAGPVDVVNLIEESGDLLWYVALALRFFGTNFATAFGTNIAKLRKRFPGKFTQIEAEIRDLGAERAVLEASTNADPLAVAAIEDLRQVWRRSFTDAKHREGGTGRLSIQDLEALLASGTPVQIKPDGTVLVGDADPNGYGYGEATAAEIAGYLGDPPEPGSVWAHRNGNRYTVECLTNLPNDTRYPLTVVYRGENGAAWSRRADDWHRSMTLLVAADHTPKGQVAQ